MSKMTQKEAVFQAITNVLKQDGIRFEPGNKVGATMTREHRAAVNSILFQGFKTGDIELETPFANDSDLKSYVSGLQSNWLRKDPRLNGGGKYTPKNVGSRAGQGDTKLKALRQLLSTQTDPKAKSEIQGYIDQRMAEIRASKKPAVTIDVNALPSALRKYASVS